MLTKATANMKPIKYWEPFCHPRCIHNMLPASELEHFGKLLSSECHRKDKCYPGSDCQEPYDVSKPRPLTIIALNPRFSDLVDWGSVLRPYADTARVVNLRRGNIVYQA